MRTQKIFSACLGILVGLALGCGPVGQVPRIIHPPLLLSKNAGPETNEQTKRHLPRTRPGLPNACQLDQRPDSFCISCEQGAIDLERCYALTSSFDAMKSCVFTPESIKCLSADPPFALNIAIRGSLEKTLMEHSRLWRDGLLAITQKDLTASLQLELDAALALTNKLVQQLVKARKPSNWVDREFTELWARVPAPMHLDLKKSLADLQKNKEAGHLKLLQVLEASRALCEASGTSAALLHYWEALSVEGLTEPHE